MHEHNETSDTFNPIKHARLINEGGISTYRKSGQSMHVESINSYRSGSGYGTAVMRNVMMTSFSNGCNGNVSLDAAWSSHVFHLYMGMEPVDWPVLRFEKEHGTDLYDSALELIEKKSLDEIGKDEIIPLSHIKRLVKLLEVSAPEDLLTEDSLQRLQNKLAEEMSYVEFRLIPVMISSVINKSSTSHLGAVQMVMSEQGKARWKEAIEQNKVFQPFKNLEHLHHFMNESQINRLVSRTPPTMNKSGAADSLQQRFKSELSALSVQDKDISSKPPTKR